MKTISCLDQARIEMIQDEKLSFFLGLDKLSTEKVKYGIIYFLEQAKRNKFPVYKTHLLKFFSLSELYYAQKHSNILFNIQYQALERGPVPMPVYRATNLFRFPSFSNEEELAKKLLPFTGKVTANRRMRILLRNDYQFSDYYFSISDLGAMKRAVNKILELKEVGKISEYLHDNSKSWNEYRKQYLLKGKKSQDMSFIFDFPDSKF